MLGCFLRKPKQAGGDASPQRHLEAALASVTDGAITADHRDRVLFMNNAAEALTGRRLQNAAGSRLADLLPLIDTETGAAIGDAVRDAASAPKHPHDGPPRWRRAVLE